MNRLACHRLLEGVGQRLTGLDFLLATHHPTEIVSREGLQLVILQ